MGEIDATDGKERRIKIVHNNGKVEYSEWFPFSELYMLGWVRALEYSRPHYTYSYEEREANGKNEK